MRMISFSNNIIELTEKSNNDYVLYITAIVVSMYTIQLYILFCILNQSVVRIMILE